MAHFAKVENGIVTQVLVVDDAYQTIGQKYLAEDLGLGGIWIQTSYNTHGRVHTNGGTPLNMNYAGIGYTWDGTGFAAPQPYSSWILDKTTYLWSAPIPYPTDGLMYEWDETGKDWKAIVNPTLATLSSNSSNPQAGA